MPELRSQIYFQQGGVAGFTHRAFAKAMGFDQNDLGHPIVGICNTFSEFNSCSRHSPELVAAVKRGVLQMGGTPLEFPTISLGEITLSPTSMLYRNLAAMDTEEMIRGLPMDSVVALVNCDKTIPAALMGVASADIPAILLSGGPMLSGRALGARYGACTDCRRLVAEREAGAIDDSTMHAIEDGIARSAGHCMVMGTASTMNCLTEALGMALPGNGSLLAVDSRRLRLAEATGRRAVQLAREGLRPSSIMTVDAFHNATTLFAALGGSTNAVIHLAAIAGRLDIGMNLDEFDRTVRATPLLCSIRPVGKWYMEDLDDAGGISAVLRQLMPLLRQDTFTVTGNTLAENVKDAAIFNEEVIATFATPFASEGGLAILRGNLAPAGAVIKYSAASPSLLQKIGRARVFDGIDDLMARIDREETDISAEDVLVLRGCGPRGAPGMPEVGNFPLPKGLLRRGVRDMIRISDARMSGTAFGTIVLHVAPESAVGGPLSLVRDGDLIELDVPGRALNLRVTETDLLRRRDQIVEQKGKFNRGYLKLFEDHVMQASEGCDFDFLQGRSPVVPTHQPKF